MVATLAALLGALVGLGAQPALRAEPGAVYLPLASKAAGRPFAPPRRPPPATQAPAPSPSATPAPSATAVPSPTQAQEPEPPAPVDDCPDEVFMDLSRYPGAGAQYPDPQLAVRCSEDELVVESNGIPHYAFVPITPNPLQAVALEFRVPLHPELAAEPSDLPLLGTAGFAVNGLPFFGPNEAGQPVDQAFGDPVYNAIMDACLGHTATVYHYHAMLVECLGGAQEGEPSPVIGFAADGFPIYGPVACLDAGCAQRVEMQSSYVRIGDPRTNAWEAYAYREREEPQYLDRCNGRVGPDGRYGYHATSDFPYILGCYAGTPTDLGGAGGGGGGGGGRPGRPPRPLDTLFQGWQQLLGR